jgi:hypothetical protein
MPFLHWRDSLEISDSRKSMPFLHWRDRTPCYQSPGTGFIFLKLEPGRSEETA